MGRRRPLGSETEAQVDAGALAVRGGVHRGGDGGLLERVPPEVPRRRTGREGDPEAHVGEEFRRFTVAGGLVELALAGRLLGRVGVLQGLEPEDRASTGCRDRHAGEDPAQDLGRGLRVFGGLVVHDGGGGDGGFVLPGREALGLDLHLARGQALPRSVAHRDGVLAGVEPGRVRGVDLVRRDHLVVHLDGGSGGHPLEDECALDHRSRGRSSSHGQRGLLVRLVDVRRRVPDTIIVGVGLLVLLEALGCLRTGSHFLEALAEVEDEGGVRIELDRLLEFVLCFVKLPCEEELRGLLGQSLRRRLLLRGREARQDQGEEQRSPVSVLHVLPSVCGVIGGRGFGVPVQSPQLFSLFRERKSWRQLKTFICK